jgi:hypothetical protein
VTSFQELQQLTAKCCRELSRKLRAMDYFELTDEGLFLLANDLGANEVRAVVKYPVHDYAMLGLEFRFLREKEKVAIVCRAYYSVEKLNVKIRSGSTRIDVSTESLLRVSCFPEGWSTEEF